MSVPAGYWARAYTLRAGDLDIALEVECPSPESARREADDFWATRLYDRVEASADEIGPGGERRVQIISAFGRGRRGQDPETAATPERPMAEAFGVNSPLTPKA